MFTYLQTVVSFMIFSLVLERDIFLHITFRLWNNVKKITYGLLIQAPECLHMFLSLYIFLKYILQLWSVWTMWEAAIFNRGIKKKRIYLPWDYFLIFNSIHCIYSLLIYSQTECATSIRPAQLSHILNTHFPYTPHLIILSCECSLFSYFI